VQCCVLGLLALWGRDRVADACFCGALPVFGRFPPGLSGIADDDSGGGGGGGGYSHGHAWACSLLLGVLGPALETLELSVASAVFFDPTTWDRCCCLCVIGSPCLGGCTHCDPIATRCHPLSVHAAVAVLCDWDVPVCDTGSCQEFEDQEAWARYGCG
jgi:hypothetical protein